MVSIRKLAALDLALHSATFILLEFGLAVFGFISIGLLVLIHSQWQGLYPILSGSALIGIGLNYVPLLFYAINIVRRKSAEEEAAYELEHRKIEMGRYTIQSLLLIIPLIILAISLYQEWQRHTKSNKQGNGTYNVHQPE